MHPDLEKMIPLQKFDLETARLRAELTALPKMLAALAAKVDTLTKQSAANAEALKHEETLRRSQEVDVKSRHDKIARLKRQMDVVTNDQQVHALEHEITFSEKEISRLEDEEIESMERTEKLEAEKTRLAEELTDATATLARERERGAATLQSHNAELKRLEAERAALRPAISDRALATYDRVSKAKGTGLAEAWDHKCLACQMMVRPQKWNEISDRSNHELLMTCETCGRWLYFDASHDRPDSLAKKSVQPTGSSEPERARAAE